MGSLKGPRHGGANSKVMAMMDDVKEHVRDWNDEGCVADYLTRILNKDAFDRSGLIYGLGHAVYTKTDPRCEVFRAYVNHLAAEKGREDELALYANVEKIVRSIRAFPPTSTFTADLSMRCWACPRSCIRPCSPWPVSPAGVPTGWRSSPWEAS